MGTSISGEMKSWHKISLDFFSNSSFSEKSSTFRDYRLDVTFTHSNSGTKITVPGFFAADGNAADTGAASGNVWRVNFNAPLDGKWTYETSFRTGKDIAANLDPGYGRSAGSFDGESGSFRVSATDKSGEDFRAKGMLLQDEGTHYLQHQGDGDYFVRGGPGVPENFLASGDIDNTPGTHDYATHIGDFEAGSPTWDGGKGKGIIGAIDYLAGQGQNTLYLMLLTAAGDGKDVWPWATTTGDEIPTDKARLSPDITSVYDISKLAQWEIVFDHADDKGIYKNIFLQEEENDQLLNGGTSVNGSSLSAERLIYLREMVSRFGHANGLQWNIGEENTNTAAERIDMAEWLKAVDPYDHVVAMHTRPGSNYRELYGVDAFDSPSFQEGASVIRKKLITYRDGSDDAGNPWILGWDENSDDSSVIDAYSNDPNSKNEVIQRDALWSVLTAGGSGVNWYIKGSNHGYDQVMDTFDGFTSMWTWTAAATDFFNTRIPFWNMSDMDGLTANDSDYVMADPGNYYVIYRPYGTAGNVRLDLSDQPGERFDVCWYDPRNGGDLISDGTVSGGRVQQIGGAPSNAGKDWVLFVKNSDLPDTPSTDGGKSDPKPVLQNTPPVARDDTASVDAGAGVRFSVLANDSDGDGDPLEIISFTQGQHGRVIATNDPEKLIYFADFNYGATDTFTYTISDGRGGTDTATATMSVAGHGGSEPNPDPDATGTQPVVSLNSGGKAVDGYAADSNVSGGRVYTTGLDISGTTDVSLYQSELFGNFSYSFALEDGVYDVTLKFAEIYHSKAGEKLFDVFAEDELVLDDFDIFAEAGGSGIAHDVTISVAVLDGALDLDFATVVNAAKLSGIEIYGAGKNESVGDGALPDGGDGAVGAGDPDATPFALGGPSLSIGQTTLYGFGHDGAPAALGQKDGGIGVSDIGADHKIDFEDGSSEMIGFDFGRNVSGIELSLRGLGSSDYALEGATFQTYDNDGAMIEAHLLTLATATDILFDEDARYATLSASDWIVTDGTPFDSHQPEFILSSFDVF